jgi:hypothetical protein
MENLDLRRLKSISRTLKSRRKRKRQIGIPSASQMSKLSKLTTALMSSVPDSLMAFEPTFDLPDFPEETQGMPISQLVPITPEKDMRLQNKPVSQVQNLYANQRIHEERGKDPEEETPGTVNSSTTISQLVPITPERDMRVQNKLVSKVQNEFDKRIDEERAKDQSNKAESFGDVSTPFKENHNPDKGGSLVIDLNGTPQQKPKRKKHLPKVVIEGKPKRTPKPVTPKPTSSKENQAVERKNVGRKGIHISSPTPPTATPPPQELTGESINQETQSCRRALNFDMEQSQDESSTCKSSINLDSELQAQDFCSKGVQSRSTLQLGGGIEVLVEVEHTKAGTAWSMNQMLKTNPPQADSQKDSTEGEGQPIAQENIATFLHDAEIIPHTGMAVEGKERGLEKNLQRFEHIPALIHKDRSTGKRSQGRTRVRDLTSLTRILECITHPTKPPLVVDDGQTVENPHKPHVAKTLAKKKRTKKRNSFVTLASSKTNEMQLDQELVLYEHRLSSSNPLGTL